MNKMSKAALLALCLLPARAFAATDVRGCATIPGSIIGVAGGQCYWLKVNPDGSINTTAGYEFNTGTIPTIQNAAYAAGQSEGGLLTIAIGSTSNLVGILDQISLASKSGSTVAKVVYVWDTTPASTTCTDKANFVANQSDNQHLVVAPILISPATVLSAQDTSTYGSATNLTGNFVSSGTSLYVCVVENGAETPPTTTDLRVQLQGVKDQP